MTQPYGKFVSIQKLKRTKKVIIFLELVTINRIEKMYVPPIENPYCTGISLVM